MRLIRTVNSAKADGHPPQEVFRETAETICNSLSLAPKKSEAQFVAV